MADVLKTEEETPTPEPAPVDLIDTLVQDEAAQVETPAEPEPEPVAEEPAAEPETPPEETPSEEPTEPVAEVPTEPEAPPAAPGTPNKALQKAQQERSAVDRQLAEIKALIEQQGNKATPAQIEKVERLQEKAEQVADEIDVLLAPGYEANPFEDQTKIVKKVKSQDNELSTLKQRLAAVEARAEAAEAESNWSKLESRYTGVDVRKAWQDAIAQAQAEGFEADLTKRANQLFHQNAAASVVAAKPATPAPATAPIPPKAKPAQPATTTARKAPPVTPGGASVTVKSGAINRPAPVSQEAKMDSLMNRLVV
jgi:vacuolar-type H+-ATPase subunit I/STV1